MKSVARTLILVLLITSATFEIAAQGAAGLREQTAAIAAGQDSAARRSAITDSLKAAGIEYRLDEFRFPRFSGTNIVVDLSGGKVEKTFLLGAHYDRVPVGQGAVDNAASCAVLLDVLKAFKAKPLRSFSVRAVFFDLEEGGLVGSQAYLASIRNQPLPAEAINLDIFGYGDTLFATSSVPDGPLVQTFQRAAQGSSVTVRTADLRQYPASDHRSMSIAGIETLGLALIDGSEIERIVERSTQQPRILTIIHTAEDTMDKVRPEEIEKAVPVIEKTIRMMDER